MTGPEDLTEEQRALIAGLREDAENRYQDGDLGALRHSTAHRPHDPAFALLLDGFTTTPVVHQDGCYICEDPEYAQMGLPLCRPCPECKRKQEICRVCDGKGGTPHTGPCSDCLGTGLLGGLGHIPADDTICTSCGYEDGPEDYR